MGVQIESQVVLRIISELERKNNKTQSPGNGAGRDEAGSRSSQLAREPEDANTLALIVGKA